MNRETDPKASSLNPMALGCVTTLGVVIIVVVGLVWFVYTRGRANQEALAEVSQRLEELRLAFPFSESQARFEPEAFSLAIRVRAEVAQGLEPFFGIGEVDGFSLEAIPESGNTLVESLEEARLSPDLYGWYGHFVAAACLLGKDGDPRFRRLWNGLEDLIANPKSNPSYLIESLIKRSRRVEPTEESFAVIETHVDELIKSMPAFLADDFILANQFTKGSQKKADPKKVDLLRRPSTSSPK